MSSHLESKFSREEQCVLLSLARSAIAAGFAGRPLKSPDAEKGCFELRRGVFVTVYVAGKLRGCIGVVEGRETLRESVIHCAESAAFHYPRFSPIRADELDALRIEISVLSELFPIEQAEIEIGRHGLLVSSGHRHGL